MRSRPLRFDELPGWNPAEVAAAWPAYVASCRALIDNARPLRSGVQPTSEMLDLSRRALHLTGAATEISDFFASNFQPLEIFGAGGTAEGFVTGYYEPELDGSQASDQQYTAPVLARPDDLIDMRETLVDGWDRTFEGARRTADGGLEPYPSRAEIENGAIGGVTRPVIWLHDHVEVFFAQVQGSARVRLPDGTRKRLVYAGRNGRPYTSIGRILIGEGEVPAAEMSLTRCKAWLRANGVNRGDRGREVMQRNDSYVFFRLEDEGPSAGPVGGQGVALTPMHSIAIDRNIWPYGTPIWIAADLSSAGLGSGPSGRLMIAQDTGSAIVGAARGDLFVGSGDRAGEIAGLIRHSARFIVLAPVGIAGYGAA